MLTENQIEKLNNLRSQYPQYNYLIDRMIEGWKITTPKPKSYGVTWTEGDDIVTIPGPCNCTCLIGSCSLGLKIPNPRAGYMRQMYEQLNISYGEFKGIIAGFDDREFETSASKQAFDFDQDVREIVL